MGRAGYGTVGGRRSGNAAWQWILIGLMVGFGCAAIFVLTLLTLGVIEIGGTDDEPQSIAAATDVPAPEVNIQGTVDAAVAAALAANADAIVEQQPTDQPDADPTQGEIGTSDMEPTADVDATIEAAVASTQAAADCSTANRGHGRSTANLATIGCPTAYGDPFPRP